MRQTTLCVPLEVKPESCSRLSALLEDLQREEDQGPGGHPANFARVAREVPALHFMSMSVFTAAAYDPIFVLEANFDGAPREFWAQMEAAFEPRLRGILRCCKRPLDEDGALYDAVTSPDRRTPVTAYFAARTEPPSAFHQGNRGLTRDRILREAALFRAVRAELDTPNHGGRSPYRGIDPAAVHARLRERMLPAHPWLNDPPQRRVTFGERAQDLVRLLAFAVAALFLLSLPGLILSVIVPWRFLAAAIGAAAALAGIVIFSKRKPLGDTGTPIDFNVVGFLLGSLPLVLGYGLGYVFLATVTLAAALTGLSGLSSLLGITGRLGFRSAFDLALPAVLWGLASLVASVPFLVLWLRYLERRDSSHDAPEIDEQLLREMIRREDWIVQNHMGSLVLIKPGVLRSVLIRAGHKGLGLLLRVTASNGYLGSMRTIHFAHWAFLNNGSRLLFLSNFDHSWDSYLDDFIEKAHNGLTMAWSCGVGFPPTRFLILDGASHGRQFKTWGLASRTVSRFWYSAYPTLSVNQIERNSRIATTLSAPRVSEKEAGVWIQDL